MPGQIEKLRDRKFPCPLCGTPLDIRLDAKRGNPYVICNSCGLQMFVRRDRGAKLMEDRVKYGVFSFLFR